MDDLKKPKKEEFYVRFACPYCGVIHYLRKELVPGLNSIFCYQLSDGGGAYGCGETFAVKCKLVVSGVYKLEEDKQG